MRNALLVAIISAAVITVSGSATTHAEQKTNVKTEVKTVATEPVGPAPVMVEIQPGDSLAKIGSVHNTTYQRLYDANTFVEDPDLIYPGDQLRIPDQSEEIATRELPANAVVPAEEQPAVAQATPISPKRTSAPAANFAAGDGSVWDRLAQCEAGGNWATNTGNGYYGGLQFTLSSWRGVGGTGYPNEASREEQIARGQMLQARSGWGAWPACSSKLGLR